MNSNGDLERRIAELYATEMPPRAPDWVLGVALETVDITSQRRTAVRAPWRFWGMNANSKVAVAAVVVIAVGAVGLAVLRPGPEPDTGAEPLIWTPERLAQDWPGSVRPEPIGGAPVVQMVVTADAQWDSAEGRWDTFGHDDPVGDVGPDELGWTDIRRVRLSSGGAVFSLDRARDLPPSIPQPSESWIAYGVVLDTNGDAVADVRIGMDNASALQHRAWRTDLASGQTSSAAGPPYGTVGIGHERGFGPSIGLDTYFPGDLGDLGGKASLWYSLQPGEEDLRFYAWASLIEGGRIAATDFAPDVGWLERGDQPQVQLVGPTWTRETPLTQGGEELTLIQTIGITADGKISFDVGCQTGVGNVTVEPGTLRLADVALTDVGCGDVVSEITAETMMVLGAEEVTYTLEGALLRLQADRHVLQLEARYEGPPG